MTQWNQTPQPAPQPKKSRRLWLIWSLIGLGAVAIIAIIMAASGGDGTYGGSPGREGVSADPGTPDASQAPHEPSSAHDVTLKSFRFDTSEDFGDLEPSGGNADISITNHSSKTSDYTISIAVLAPNGDRIGTLETSAVNVAPGQTVDNGEEDALGVTHLEPVAGAHAKITDVVRDASLNEDGTEKG